MPIGTSGQHKSVVVKHFSHEPPKKFLKNHVSLVRFLGKHLNFLFISLIVILLKR